MEIICIYGHKRMAPQVGLESPPKRSFDKMQCDGWQFWIRKAMQDIRNGR